MFGKQRARDVTHETFYTVLVKTEKSTLAHNGSKSDSAGMITTVDISPVKRASHYLLKPITRPGTKRFASAERSGAMARDEQTPYPPPMRQPPHGGGFQFRVLRRATSAKRFDSSASLGNSWSSRGAKGRSCAIWFSR